MKLTFAPKEIIQIDDCRIVHRNLSGRGDKYNREGDRNFSIVIPDEEIAQALTEKGWNVHVKPPKEPGDTPFMFLPVKVKFNDYGPIIYVVSNGTQVKLDATTVNLIDTIDIDSVNLDVRPYDWEVNGATGRSAYLQTMQVIQKVSRFENSDFITQNL